MMQAELLHGNLSGALFRRARVVSMLGTVRLPPLSTGFGFNMEKSRYFGGLRRSSSRPPEHYGSGYDVMSLQDAPAGNPNGNPGV